MNDICRILPVVIVLAFTLAMIELTYFKPLRCIREVDVTDGRWDYIETYCNMDPQQFGPFKPNPGIETSRPQSDNGCHGADDSKSGREETEPLRTKDTGQMGDRENADFDPLNGQMDAGCKTACALFILILVCLFLRSKSGVPSERLFCVAMSILCLAYMSGRENTMAVLNLFSILKVQDLPSFGSCTFVDPDDKKEIDILCVIRANEFIPTAIKLTYYTLLPLAFLDGKALLEG